MSIVFFFCIIDYPKIHSKDLRRDDKYSSNNQSITMCLSQWRIKMVHQIEYNLQIWRS